MFSVINLQHLHRFKIDSNYVGPPPALEVTFCNLNDNIDKPFLTDMVQKFGTVEELSIFYHPLSNKHLGLGRVVFESVKSAKACVEKYHGISVMGKVLKVLLDAFGEECKKMFDDLSTASDRKTIITVAPPPVAAAALVEDPEKTEKKKIIEAKVERYEKKDDTLMEDDLPGKIEH